jgi:hypothetical protein
MIKKCNVCGINYKTANSKSKYCSKDCYRLTQKTFNEISIYDNYAALFIENKKYGRIVVLIDIEDIELVSKYKWHAIYDKTVNDFYICHRYANKEMGKGCIKMHRLIMGCPKNLFIDHINHSTIDNRKCNLRVVTHFGNQQNLRSRVTEQTGVYQRKTGGCNWVANISKNNKKFQKEFKTKEEAIAARKQYEKDLYS